jgi:hypothetical protein
MSGEVIRLDLRGAQITECPRCHSPVPFRRAHDPNIDSAGFEAYTLFGSGCGKSFSGIIDPFDDAFLSEADYPK